MTNQEKEAKLQAILTDESAVAQLMTIQSVEDAQKVFAQYGLNVSVEETDAIIGSIIALASKAQTGDAELNEAELVSVSGGWGLFSSAVSGVSVGIEVLRKYWGKLPWMPVYPTMPKSPWRP